MDATTGDPVAIVGVLDCAAGQLLPVDIDFFGMLRGLDDRIGLSWYDDVIGALHNSQHFPRLAQNMGDFANTIGDLDVLENVGSFNKIKNDKHGNPIYGIYEGSGQSILDNFAHRWNLETGQNRLDYGDTTMRLYEATGGSDRWTIMVNRGGNIAKYRFEKWK